MGQGMWGDRKPRSIIGNRQLMDAEDGKMRRPAGLIEVFAKKRHYSS